MLAQTSPAGHEPPQQINALSCLCPRINSFAWRNSQGQPGFVLCLEAFKLLWGEILLHALLCRLIPWDLIWDRWSRTDFSHGCSISAGLWGHTQLLVLSPSPSLEIPISAGWWPVAPLGVGQRLEEPHGRSSPRDGPLQGITGVEKGNPTLPLPGGGTSLLCLEQIQSKGLGRVPGKETDCGR